MGFLESFARLEQCGGNDGLRLSSGQNDIATDSFTRDDEQVADLACPYLSRGTKKKSLPKVQGGASG